MYSEIQKNLKHILLLTIVFNVLFVSNIAVAEMVVVVHPDNNSPINKASVKKIFLGKTNSFMNGSKAVPIEVAEGEVREEFLRTVINRDEGSVASYWARMMFTGKAVPPKAFADQKEVKTLVANNPNLIGFIDSSLVDESVKVVRLN